VDIDNQRLLELARKFYFEAAQATWVALKDEQVPKFTIPEIPGSEVYRFDKEPFHYIDKYVVSGQYSGEETIIYLREGKDVPIWIMQYHGWSKEGDKRIIPFLKQALKEAYSRHLWLGGRGPTQFPASQTADRYSTSGLTEGTLVYRSWPEQPNEFHTFKGVERIIAVREVGVDEILFWHRYHGMALFDVDPGN
jgi:hypothetical protein